MKGQIVLITGSASGIGRQAAIEMADLGATVILHARSLDKGAAAMEMVRRMVPGASVDLLIADLEVQDQIKQMACLIKSAYSRLDILVNNAEVQMEERKLTIDTIEKTFAVNHLAPFMLAHLLLPLLKSAPAARIINISSHAHYTARFNSRNLQGEQTFCGEKIYSSSKLCNLLFTYYLANKLKAENITVNAMHPGLRNYRSSGEMFEKILPEALRDGADTIIFLASSLEVKNMTGLYFTGRLPIPSSSCSCNRHNQRRLWEISERLTLIHVYDPSWHTPTVSLKTKCLLLWKKLTNTMP
jgi:NAD(P)-dependent dehydrogenase (short-subunit alcohol dehydrogenase family)